MKLLKCGDKSLDLSSPVIMGVLNVTPILFLMVAVICKLMMPYVKQNQWYVLALIIDIGAESTRPNAHPVSEQQELDRILPVIERIKQQLDVVISIDTLHSSQLF